MINLQPFIPYWCHLFVHSRIFQGEISHATVKLINLGQTILFEIVLIGTYFMKEEDIGEYKQENDDTENDECYDMFARSWWLLTWCWVRFDETWALLVTNCNNIFPFVQRKSLFTPFSRSQCWKSSVLVLGVGRMTTVGTFLSFFISFSGLNNKKCSMENIFGMFYVNPAIISDK